MWYLGNQRPIPKETAMSVAEDLDAGKLFRFRNRLETHRGRFQALRSEIRSRHGYRATRVDETKYLFRGGKGRKKFTVELDDMTGQIYVEPHPLMQEIYALYDRDVIRIPYRSLVEVVKWATRYAFGIQLFNMHSGVRLMPIEEDFKKISLWIERTGFGKVFSCSVGSDIFEAIRGRYAETAEQDLRREKVRFSQWIKAGHKNPGRWKCWESLLDFFEARHRFYVSKIGSDDIPALLPGIETMRGWLDGNQNDSVPHHQGDGRNVEGR
jgi:hypothetical protein